MSLSPDRDYWIRPPSPKHIVAADRGLAFVRASFDQLGVPRARIGFDLAFSESVDLAEAGERLRTVLGTDLEYRIGEEGFSAMLALDLLPKNDAGLTAEQLRHLVRIAHRCRRGWRFRFFVDEDGFPPDTDCTALASAALYDRGMITRSELVSVACELLKATASQDRAAPGDDGDRDRGALMVYWPDELSGRSRGHKFDPVVCANALCVLLEALRLERKRPGATIAATTRYVVDHLASGRYLEGTRYYPYPEVFVYWASRLCARFPSRNSVLAAGLRKAITALEARPDEQRTCALNVALRTIAADNVGLRRGQRQRRDLLAGQQHQDGSWPACTYYKLGRHPVYFGSAALTTLFAIRALQPHRVRQGVSDE